MENTTQILQLIEEMKANVEDWEREEDVDLEQKYGHRVQELDAWHMINLLFRNFQNSTDVIVLMKYFFFIWKDFNYQNWKELYYSFAIDKVERYHFEWFCLEILEIDVRKLILGDEQLSKMVKPAVSEGTLGFTLVKTTEPGSFRAKRMFRENGMEAIDYWRKLKSQGAPMRIDI